MTDDDTVTNRELREEQALQRLGTRDPRCRLCGESRAVALLRRRRGIICYECDNRARGRPTTELHHVFGRNNSCATVEMLANDHRVMNHRMVDWPRETLLNPRGSQLRRRAAQIRGMLDFFAVFSEQLDGLPELLESLDDEMSGGPLPAQSDTERHDESSES
jgi:hypothetical protein